MNPTRLRSVENPQLRAVADVATSHVRGNDEGLKLRHKAPAAVANALAGLVQSDHLTTASTKSDLAISLGHRSPGGAEWATINACRTTR